MFIRIRGKLHCLWRAVDQNGHALDILMQRSKLPRHAQRSLSAHARIHNHVQFRRNCLTANQHRAARDHALHTWRDLAGVAAAA